MNANYENEMPLNEDLIKSLVQQAKNEGIVPIEEICESQTSNFFLNNQSDIEIIHFIHVY